MENVTVRQFYSLPGLISTNLGVFTWLMHLVKMSLDRLLA